MCTDSDDYANPLDIHRLTPAEWTLKKDEIVRQAKIAQAAAIRDALGQGAAMIGSFAVQCISGVIRVLRRAQRRRRSHSNHHPKGLLT